MRVEEKINSLRVVAVFVVAMSGSFVAGVLGISLNAHQAARNINKPPNFHYSWGGPLMAVLGVSFLIGLIGLAIMFLIVTHDHESNRRRTY